MTAELWNLKEIGRYLNVSGERTRHVADDDPTFPAPAKGLLRRRSRTKAERWAERYGWDTLPWQPGPQSEKPPEPEGPSGFSGRKVDAKGPGVKPGTW